MTAPLEQLERFEVVLPNGDRATASSPPAIVLAARTLCREAGVRGAPTSTMLRRGLLAYRDGRLDGELTRRCSS